jgi:hypothetical protein
MDDLKAASGLGILEREWRSFCLACFGDIGDQQYIDLRRTFYGGAAAIWGVLMHKLEGGGEPTENDLEMARGILDELVSFNEDVKAGRK